MNQNVSEDAKSKAFGEQIEDHQCGTVPDISKKADSNASPESYEKIHTKIADDVDYSLPSALGIATLLVLFTEYAQCCCKFYPVHDTCCILQIFHLTFNIVI